MIEQLTKIAVDIFKAVLSTSAESGGTFRILITAKIAEEDKPVLLVGNAHSRVEDGHVIAILNPDEAILEKIVAGCSYAQGLLIEEVSGKCDAMVELWVDAYKADGVSQISKYKTRELKPAKFVIK
jgi:hypothetical protein